MLWCYGICSIFPAEKGKKSTIIRKDLDCKVDQRRMFSGKDYIGIQYQKFSPAEHKELKDKLTKYLKEFGKMTSKSNLWKVMAKLKQKVPHSSLTCYWCPRRVHTIRPEKWSWRIVQKFLYPISTLPEHLHSTSLSYAETT